MPNATSTSFNQINFERILGNSVKTKHQLSLHPKEDLLAYIASGILIIYSLDQQKPILLLNPPPLKKQSHKISSTYLKCVMWSKNGSYLAAGEVGKNPRVLVWKKEMNGTYELLFQWESHQFGVRDIQWTPDSLHVVSLGKKRIKDLI